MSNESSILNSQTEVFFSKINQIDVHKKQIALSFMGGWGGGRGRFSCL